MHQPKSGGSQVDPTSPSFCSGEGSPLAVTWGLLETLQESITWGDLVQPRGVVEFQLPSLEVFQRCVDVTHEDTI